MVKPKIKSVLITEALDDGLINNLTSLGIKADVKLNVPFPDLVAQIKNYDAVIINSKFQANTNFLTNASQLKLITVIGNRVDNVDLEEANNKNILITSVPNFQSVAIAEFMCSLLLLLARPIVQSCVKLKTGIWDRDASRGLELQGKTVALLGNVVTCSEVAKRISSFGVQVICYIENSSQGCSNTSISVNSTGTSTSNSSTSQSTTKESKRKSEISLLSNQMSVEEMCTRGDFFCFIMNNEKLKSLFTVECLRKFKQGVRLICYGLPTACPEADLLEALNSGKIAALALDLDESTAGRSRKLIEHPNVICTPALSDATIESQLRLSNLLTAQFQSILAGKPPSECINPQALVDQPSSPAQN